MAMMSWGKWVLAVAAIVLLGGCGRSGPAKPEEEIAIAVQREEGLKGELLLAEAEVARARVREAPVEFHGNRAKTTRAKRTDLRDARHIEAECNEGNGLESCTTLDAIEEIVEELARVPNSN